MVERQTAVIREFNELVPENYEFHDPLAKIFYRKIKRSNKRSGDDEDEGSGSDEDMDNEDFDDDDEEEDDEEEEVCPLGCDQVSITLLHKKRVRGFLPHIQQLSCMYEGQVPTLTLMLDHDRLCSAGCRMFTRKFVIFARSA